MAMPPTHDSNRARYDAGLRQIESDILRMGTVVLEMLDLATRTAIEDDLSLADCVLEREREVDAMQHRIMERVIVMLALQGPVAHDLLLLTASFTMFGELEKVGDEATKLASRVCKLQGSFPFEMNELLQEISKLSQANLREALRLYSQYSAEGADKLIAQDDMVDRMYKTSRNMILEMMKEQPDNLRQLLRCSEVFHALEHVSDHTVDMAKGLKGCYQRYAETAIAE